MRTGIGGGFHGGGERVEIASGVDGLWSLHHNNPGPSARPLPCDSRASRGESAVRAGGHFAPAGSDAAFPTGRGSPAVALALAGRKFEAEEALAVGSHF